MDELDHPPAVTTAPSGEAGGLRFASVELFTGAGGLALGTHAAGFRHVALFERNEEACDTIRANASGGRIPAVAHWSVRQGDVRQVSFGGLGPVDLVAGGPPCQPFSLGGKHGAAADPRNMIPEFCRAVRELRPRAFIMENVRGLTRATFRPYFDYVLRQLALPDVPPASGESWEEHDERLGREPASAAAYTVRAAVLDAADFGVPQHRHRVFVVGFRADLGLSWVPPEPTHDGACLWRDQWETGAYWRRHGVAPPAQPWRSRPASGPAGNREAWRTLRDAIGDLGPPGRDTLRHLELNHRLVPGARAYPGHTGSRVDEPSKALKAGVHGVPGGENTVLFPDGTLRYLSVREAARVQTFPDEWRLEGAWSEAMRQIGNAVPVRLAQAVAASVAAQVGG